MSDTTLIEGETATLTIVFTETVAAFSSAADVTCQTGTLAAMSISSGSTWTGTFTPTDDTDDSTNICTLATSYTDVAGNAGTGATTSNYDVDTLDPAVSSISLADTDIISGDTPLLTIVFSSAVSGFASGDDVTCPNGNLATMTSSDDTTWTGTFTPSSSTTDTSNTCNVGTGYLDDAGNSGGAGQSANYKVDTVAPTVSSISFADTALKAGETSLVTIVFSEAVAGFANGDLSIASGTMSAVADSGDSITWTSTFTPTANTEDNTNVLSITASSYTDTLGNAGAAGSSANYEVETLKPTASTIAMTTSNSNSALAKSGDTITLTITMSETVTSLSCTIDGEATTMGGSGTSWTSALTLSGDETEQSTVFSAGLLRTPLGTQWTLIPLQTRVL